jgi:type III pantothenate kinase
MNLILDIGTSYIKTAIFNKSEMIFRESLPEISPEYISLIIHNYPDTLYSILSSVRKRNPVLLEYLDKNFRTFIELSNKTPLPIKNLYGSPETLGYDRIAAIVGANTICPDTSVLVTDIGSAITIDFINNRNEFHGGNISPGMMMRFRALNEFTANLPLEYPHENPQFMGSDTTDAIIAGVQNGIIFELEGYIRRFSGREKDLKVIFTGGDAASFAEKINDKILVEPDLTLKGLNKILESNLKRDIRSSKIPG